MNGTRCEFWLVCKNARICNEVFLAQMLMEASEIRWGVICLSETRAADGEYIVEGGHCLFCGRGESYYAGAAILIHKRWVHSITACVQVSDRIVYIDLVVFGKTYRIIAVYVPHQGYPLEDFTFCFDHLRETVLDAHKKGIQCMMGGDFNTELERGWRSGYLREYVAEVGLDVVNDTIDGEHLEETWTFRSNMGMKRTLDYCMVSDGIIVHSWKVLDSFCLRSDHRGVQSCIYVPTDIRPNHVEARAKKIDWQQYKKVGATTVLQPTANVDDLEQEVLGMSKRCPLQVTNGGLRP